MEFTEEEIAQAVEAAGRRNIANWDLLTSHDKWFVEAALRVLALEWLRARVREQREATAG